MGLRSLILRLRSPSADSAPCPSGWRTAAHGWGHERVVFPTLLPLGPAAGGVRRQVPSGHALCSQPGRTSQGRGRAPSQGSSSPACWPGPERGVGLRSGTPQVRPVEPKADLPASLSVWNPSQAKKGAPAQPRYPHRCRGHPSDSKHSSNSAGPAASGSQDPAELVHLQDGGSWKIGR